MFNADDRAAALNAGSYQSIPLSVRVVVNREFEQFVHSNIAAGISFALETTLPSTITFEQAKLAKEKGFRVFMRYVALETVEQHIERVKRRAALPARESARARLSGTVGKDRLAAGSVSGLAAAGARLDAAGLGKSPP